MMSWAVSILESCAAISCRYLREEGELACLCLVSALVIQPVLLCSVLRRFVHVTGCGEHLFVILYTAWSLFFRKIVFAHITPLL